MPATWKKLAYEDNVVKHSLATQVDDFLVAPAGPPWGFARRSLADTQTTLGLGSMAYETKTEYVLHALSTAANDFLVGTGTDEFVKKTLAQTQAILGSQFSLTFAIPGADLTAAGIIMSATVDTNAEGIGAPLMMAADGHYDTADADADTTAPCVAIALETGTGTKNVLLLGIIRRDAWDWTIGPGKASLIYLSTTVGTLTQTQPSGVDDVIQVVGWAISADVMFFCPQLNYITHTG
jgi:hypothetical protein